MRNERPLGKVAPPAPEVTISRPIVGELIDYFEFPGQTEAVGEVEIRARVSGYLVKINFEDGQEVKKGDVLFEIDPRPYQVALGPSQRRLGTPARTLGKGQSDMRRADSLRPSGAISEDEYEQHVAQLKTHQASIQSAEAAIRDAQLNLAFTPWNRPIDGRISRRMITEGNLVQSGSNESTLLTTVVTVDPIYVNFNIEEPALLKFQNLDWRLGQDGRPHEIKDLKVPVEIGLPNEEGFPHRGRARFPRQQDRSHHGHDLRSRRVRQRPKVPDPRPFCPRPGALRQTASGDVGERTGNWHATSGRNTCLP